jgi:hypothetical protein
MIKEADHARQLFKEIKRDVTVEGGRGLAKSVSLPVIEYPQKIFTQRKKKK